MNLISNFFNEINIGYILKRKTIFIIYSEKILKIIKLFLEQGLIVGYCFDYSKGSLYIVIFLKYIGGKPLFKKIQRISKPSRKFYIKKNIFLKTYFTTGDYLILNSHKGLFFSNYKDINSNFINGEVLAKIIYN